MFPRVSAANPLNDYRIEIKFDNGEVKIFDVSPYLQTGIFKELREKKYFDSIFVEDGTVRWRNGQDFCPDTLYSEGKNVNEVAMTV